MFTMTRGWERIFHVCTYLAQGSSYLHPFGYAVMHRMHHAYSDTAKDPHSPCVHKNPCRMMRHTRDVYRKILNGELEVEPRFLASAPRFEPLDSWGTSYYSSVAWGLAYIAFYVGFATQWWQFALLPIHFLMGPLHGAIVNWFGHWFGYRNFDSRDASKNTLAIDILTCGELFQNNHHTHASSANFAKRWFELDPTYPAIRIFHWLGVIQLRQLNK